jgi:hypothetical protein
MKRLGRLLHLRASFPPLYLASLLLISTRSCAGVLVCVLVFLYALPFSRHFTVATSATSPSPHSHMPPTHSPLCHFLTKHRVQHAHTHTLPRPSYTYPRTLCTCCRTISELSPALLKLHVLVSRYISVCADVPVVVGTVYQSARLRIQILRMQTRTHIPNSHQLYARIPCTPPTHLLLHTISCISTRTVIPLHPNPLHTHAPTHTQELNTVSVETKKSDSPGFTALEKRREE